MADDSIDPLAALGRKSWEELEAIESADGRVLFPDTVKLKQKDGTLREVPIALRVPRKDERRKARSDAREWAKKEGLDPEQDKALFDEMDNLCILARAMRERAAPNEQHMLPQQLEHQYDGRSLQELWDRLQIYEDLLDPRVGITNEADFWSVVGAVVKARNILPLTVLGSLAQNESILRMAREALLSPTFKSFCSQLESSTLDP